jgi:hypothetical protein
MCTKLQNASVLFEKQVDITQISPNELWIAWGRFVFFPHPFKRRLGKLFFFYMRMMNSDLHYQQFWAWSSIEGSRDERANLMSKQFLPRITSGFKFNLHIIELLFVLVCARGGLA